MYLKKIYLIGQYQGQGVEFVEVEDSKTWSEYLMELEECKEIIGH